MDWNADYEVILGSAVDNDGVSLEARAKMTGEVVLLSFYSDADGSMSFEQHHESLPPGFVKWFRAESERSRSGVGAESEGSWSGGCPRPMPDLSLP